MDANARKIVQEMIREELEKELEEVSTCAAAGGYDTPGAFKKTPEEGDGPIVRKHLGEARSKYETYKLDESGTVPQKIGRAITEINRRLNEIDALLEMNERLKTENNLGSTGLWKRTMKHLTRMESKILNMSRRLKELKS